MFTRTWTSTILFSRVSASRKTASVVRILGIDPGTRKLGYGVIDLSPPARLKYVECGVIAPRPTLALAARLAEIAADLGALLRELRPDTVAVEEVFYGKNVRSMLALGQARGVALAAAAGRGVAVVGYPPAAIKKSVVGHGRASKAQIGFLVRALLALRKAPPVDASDALAVAICHARSRGRDSVVR